MQISVKIYFGYYDDEEDEILVVSGSFPPFSRCKEEDAEPIRYRYQRLKGRIVRE